MIDIDARPYIAHEFYANVEVRDGRPSLIPGNPGQWLATLSRLAGTVKVTIQRPRLRRSQEANSYYWAAVLPDVLAGLRQLAADVGERCPFADVEDLHEALKYRFLGVEVVRLPGVKMAGEAAFERPHSSAKLDSKQFAMYVDSIKHWVATLGIYVRDPGEEVSA